MTLKRKSTAPIPTHQKKKATKVKEGSDKSAKPLTTPSSSAKTKLPTPVTSDQEEFAKFEDDELESDDLDANASGEDEASEDEETMAIDSPKLATFQPTNGKEKVTPVHAAQRALAKERKLSRPNGIPFPDNHLH
jgi:hypothetical protein